MERRGQIEVIKNTGEKVLYDSTKLRTSLLKAGASEQEVELVLTTVASKLEDGLTTKKIYQYAHEQLKKQKSHRVAGRFSLKHAILNLGPSGYPFEIFVGRLFESFGFHVQIGVMMQGKCIQHEVDVVAKRPEEIVIVETKFRGDFKGKTTVQVPLYIHSRFNDVKAKLEEEHEGEHINIRGAVVTNTRFTSDAINYAECVGLQLISWDYPEDGSLKYYTDLSGLHPITSLRLLKKYEQKKLLDQGIVLSSELKTSTEQMRENGITDARIKSILQEADLLNSR